MNTSSTRLLLMGTALLTAGGWLARDGRIFKTSDHRKSTHAIEIGENSLISRENKVRSTSIANGESTSKDLLNTLRSLSDAEREDLIERIAARYLEAPDKWAAKLVEIAEAWFAEDRSAALCFASALVQDEMTASLHRKLLKEFATADFTGLTSTLREEIQDKLKDISGSTLRMAAIVNEERPELLGKWIEWIAGQEGPTASGTQLSALGSLAALAPPERREEIFNSIMDAMPGSALATVATIPLIREVARDNPEQALQLLRRTSNGPEGSDALMQVFRTVAASDPITAANWLNTPEFVSQQIGANPGSTNDETADAVLSELLESYVETLLWLHPETALQNASLITDSRLRERFITLAQTAISEAGR